MTAIIPEDFPPVQVQSGYAEVNGARLYYESAGKGPPIIFVHGFSFDRSMWDEQFTMLSMDRHVIRYDLRGFGNSSKPNGTRYSHATDLHSLMEHLEIERADIVGLSLGGEIAIDLTLAYPDTVRALVLINALYAGFKWSQDWAERIALIWELGREFGVRQARDSWMSHPLFDPLREKPKVYEKLKKIVTNYSGWHFVNTDTATLLHPAASHLLTRIQAPTLVIIGERDLADFCRMATEMTAQIPKARKLMLPGVGHMSNMEAPGFVNGAILGFLAGIEQ